MLLFTFSGTAVLLGLAGLCLAVIGCIVLLRAIVGRLSRQGQKRINQHKLVYRYSEPIHGLSLCVAIAASVLAINWTQPMEGPLVYEMGAETIEDIIVNIPVIPSPPPPPPPPPPPVIEPVPDDIIDEPEPFQNMDIEPEEPVLPPSPQPVQNTAPAPAPPPPVVVPPAPPEKTDPVLFVEHMPTFGADCLDLSGAERKTCSDKALMAFIYKHLKYPSFARENGIQGNVVLSFVVEKDGSISGIEALRKVGGGCTEQAIGALEAINEEGQKFSPGIQNMRKVRVKFTLPVQFRLE